MARRESLTKAAFSGALWTASGWGVAAASQLVFGVLLARILGPETIGIFAAALVLVRFPAIVGNLGVAQAMVRKPCLDPADAPTALAVSLGLSSIVGFLVWLLAPWVADFYRIPEITRVLRSLAFIFPLQGLAAVPRALLQRSLRYRELAAVSATAYVVGYGVPGILLALTGLGLEALVVATLGQATMDLVLLSLAQPFSKLPRIDRDSLREMLSFGGGVTIGNFFNFVAFQADRLITGRILGAEMLGLYSRSYSLMATSTKLYSSVASTTLFPLLSRAQEEPERVRRALQQGMTLNGFLVMPLGAVLFVAAPELITALLGAEWFGAIDPFRVLVLALVFRGTDKLTGPILMALGKVYRLAAIQALFALMVVAGAWIGTNNGIFGVAIGVLAAIVTHSTLLFFAAARLTSTRWGAALTPMVRPLLATFVTLLMALLLARIAQALDLPDPLFAGLVTLVPFSLLGLAALLGPRLVFGKETLGTLRQVPAFRHFEAMSLASRRGKRKTANSGDE